VNRIPMKRKTKPYNSIIYSLFLSYKV